MATRATSEMLAHHVAYWRRTETLCKRAQMSVQNSAVFPIHCEIRSPTRLALAGVSGDSALVIDSGTDIATLRRNHFPNRNHRPEPESHSRTEIIVPKLLPN